jgi:tryptophan-rich sensory protein
LKPGTLAGTALATAATAVIGGLASRPAQSAWYANLKKPPYQPPRQAFPIVWPVLYADIAAISAATIDDLDKRETQDQRRNYIAALLVNLILNGSWSWLFFNRRRLGTASIAAGALAISSADLTRRSVAVRGAKAAPMAAYAMWTSFATVLATHIWFLNRR